MDLGLEAAECGENGPYLYCTTMEVELIVTLKAYRHRQ